MTPSFFAFCGLREHISLVVQVCLKINPLNNNNKKKILACIIKVLTAEWIGLLL